MTPIKAALLFIAALAVASLGTAYIMGQYEKTCMPGATRGGWDWANPPRICRLGGASDEGWSWEAKMCVLSCPGSGCV